MQRTFPYRPQCSPRLWPPMSSPTPAQRGHGGPSWCACRCPNSFPIIAKAFAEGQRPRSDPHVFDRGPPRNHNPLAVQVGEAPSRPESLNHPGVVLKPKQVGEHLSRHRPQRHRPGRSPPTSAGSPLAGWSSAAGSSVPAWGPLVCAPPVLPCRAGRASCGSTPRPSSPAKRCSRRYLN